MKKLRPTGDQTRFNILKAAKTLFVKQGFAATSISQIATRAKINQSLIYHHFKDKKSLWQLVKETSMQDYFQALNKVFQDTHLSGIEFIRTTFRTRIEMFLKKPDIQKMLYWQLLESNTSLHHTPQHTPDLWLTAIKRLQTEKKLRQDISAEQILAVISSCINGLAIYIDMKRLPPQEIEACRALMEQACIAAIV